MPVRQLPQTDTVWVLSSASGLEVANQVATVLIAAVLLFVLIALLITVLQLRKGVGALQSAAARLEPSSHAVMERVRGISENVEAITRSVRGDVESVTTSVEALTSRLHQASDRMEERIEDFNALMEVVQEEAEQIFVGTASTVHGIRSGTVALTRGTEPDADPELDPPESPNPE